RPLCKSQTTNSNQIPQLLLGVASPVLCAEASQTSRPSPACAAQGPTVRFLRTQQCARNPATPASVVPTPPEGGGTSRAAITLNRITSAPLVSCHPTTRTVMKDESAP